MICHPTARQEAAIWLSGTGLNPSSFVLTTFDAINGTVLKRINPLSFSWILAKFRPSISIFKSEPVITRPSPLNIVEGRLYKVIWHSRLQDGPNRNGLLFKPKYQHDWCRGTKSFKLLGLWFEFENSLKEEFLEEIDTTFSLVDMEARQFFMSQ